MGKIFWVLSAGVLILIVIALRAVLGKRMSVGLRYALWGLVLLRLLIPGTVFHSPLSVANAVQSAQNAESVQRISTALSETMVYSGTLKDTAFTPEEAEQAHGGQIEKIHGYSVESGKGDLRTYFFRDSLRNVSEKVFICLWYSGIAVTALIFTVSNLRLYFRLKQRCRRIEVDCPLPVYAVEHLSSSCLFGRAVYVSAETAENAAQLRHVLAHELSHYRHGDSLWAFLRCAALALHWFNPLVWWAAVLSRHDSELFADAGAVKTLGEDAREDYGVTLIQLSARCAKNASLLCTATTMTSGKRALTERIRGIAKRTRMTAAVVIAVVLIAALAVGCAFTGAKKEQKEFYPTALDIEVYDPAGNKILRSADLTVCDGDEAIINELYGVYTDLTGKAETVRNEDVPQTFDSPIYVLHFRDSELGEDQMMQMWSSGLFAFDVTAHYQDHRATIYMAEDAERYVKLFESCCADSSVPSSSIDLKPETIEPLSVSISIPYSSNSKDYRIGCAADDIALSEKYDAYIGMLRDRAPTEETLGTPMYAVSFELPDADPVSFSISGNGVAFFSDDETRYQVGRKYFTLFDTLFQKLEGHSSFHGDQSETDDLAALQKSDPESFTRLVLSWQEELQLPTQVTVDKAYDYDAVIKAWSEALAACYVSDSLSVDNPYRCSEASVNYAGAGIKQVSLLTSRPQKLAFDCSLLLHPVDLRRFYHVDYSYNELNDGCVAEYDEYVLRSEDGYTWTFQSKGTGGIGLRSYRALTVTDVDMKVLIENYITEAYRNGKVSDQCDRLLYTGEFIPWSDLTNEQFNAVTEALKEAAIDESYYLIAPIVDDHLYRDLHMMYAAAKADGAYSELFFETLLPMQYENDPDAFLAAVDELPEEIYDRIVLLLAFIR